MSAWALDETLPNSIPKGTPSNVAAAPKWPLVATLTDPVLLTEWLLPVVELEPGACSRRTHE